MSLISMFSRYGCERWLQIAFFTPFLTALSGCSGDSGPTTYAATGTVTYQGKPIEGATVTFHASESGVTAIAMTNDEGKFEVRTYFNTGRDDKPGMVEGDYQVTVTKLDVESIKSTLSPPKDLLPKKYASPASSPLSATVSSTDDNRYTFSLQ